MPASRLRSFLILGATVSGLHNSLNDMTLLSPSPYFPPPATIHSPSPFTSDCIHVRRAELYTASLAVPTDPTSLTKYPDNSSRISSHHKGNLAGNISKLAAITSFHTLSNSLFTDNSIIPCASQTGICKGVSEWIRETKMRNSGFFSRS